jgi:ferredoxin
MYVSANKDRCCGAGHCVLIVPQVFDQNEHDGTVILLQDHPPADLHQLVWEAAEVCPTKAIEIIETSVK